MPTTETRRPDAVSEQPVLFCGIDENSSMSVKIVENAGAVLHSWTLDVFDHRDNSEHLPEDYRPLSRPGGRIAGLLSLDSGDFVLNFEPSGPMRIDVCERLIWRRQLVTRHSATLADNGNFHLSGNVHHESWPSTWPQAVPSVIDAPVIEITADGDLVDELSVADPMIDNNLEGTLFAGSRPLFGVTVSGDVFRLNDISSRIVVIDARDNSAEVVFAGSAEIPFFTDIMDKHQWLPNGNLLITESRWPDLGNRSVRKAHVGTRQRDGGRRIRRQGRGHPDGHKMEFQDRPGHGQILGGVLQ